MTSEAGRVPRVLVVASEPMEGVTGTAITLTGLFGDWPVGSLAQLVLTPPTTGTDVARNTVVAPPTLAPLDHGVRSTLGLLRSRQRSARSAPDIAGPPDLLRGSRRTARHRLHAHARAAADLSPVVVPHALRDWIRGFGPDVVYSLLGSVRMMRVARAAGEIACVPVVPHFMDDWPETLYARGELAGLARRVVLRELDGVVRRAPAALTISTAMAVEYADRFGRSFEAFANPVKVDPTPPDAPAPGQALTLMYVGGLHLDRWRTLRDLGRLLDAVDGEMCRWRLRIHAPARDLALHGSALAQPGSIELGASLAPADVPAALAAADVLVHVESFDPEITRYTRLSLSTKIPQYLAAGRPLLAIGPRANASISLVEDSGSGVVVGESSMEELHEALVALGDLRTREGMAQRAVATAQRDFSMSAVRGGLRDVLGRASSGAPLVDRS